MLRWLDDVISLNIGREFNEIGWLCCLSPINDYFSINKKIYGIFALYLRGFLIHSHAKNATFVGIEDLADGTKNTTENIRKKP